VRESKSPLTWHPKKAAEDKKTLAEAIRQHAMAGLPPVESARLTGSRRHALARLPADEKRYQNSNKKCIRTEWQRASVGTV